MGINPSSARLARRLRAKWVDVHTDETFFRDTAHGFMAWALATLLVVFVLGAAVSSAIGAGVQAASTVASGAAVGASAGAASNSSADSGATSYFVDALFRPDASRPAAPGAEGDAAAAAQASRILIASAAAGEVSPDDKAYLGQLVAARTGLSEADATARVNALFPQLDAKAEFAWAGSFGTTTTGLPYIGELTGYAGVFAAQGYGGNGITYSQIASELIATAIAGGEDGDAGLFAFGRTSMLRRVVDWTSRLAP